VGRLLICRVNQLAQGYKKSTFHRYVPLHTNMYMKAIEIVCKSFLILADISTMTLEEGMDSDERRES